MTLRQEFAWQTLAGTLTEGQFFERIGRKFNPNHHGQMTGNPVGIGDGCATVTGYKLPKPLIDSDREGGSEIRSPKSGYRFGCARRDRQGVPLGSPAINFSV